MKLTVNVKKDDMISIAMAMTIQRKELKDEFDRMRELIEKHENDEIDITQLLNSTQRGSVRLMIIAIKHLLDEEGEDLIDIDD